MTATVEISTIIRARLAEGRAIADEDVRALLNENARLREAIEMARECIEDVDIIGAHLTLTKALEERTSLGEKETNQ